MTEEEKRKEWFAQKLEAKKSILQEQTWFALSTVGFLVFATRLVDVTPRTFVVYAISIATLTIFCIYLLIGRHQALREIVAELDGNNEKVASIRKERCWRGVWEAVSEMSGTLYYVALVLAIGISCLVMLRGKIK